LNLSKAGEVVALVGPSGGENHDRQPGAALLRPTAGSVRIDGRDVRSFSLAVCDRSGAGHFCSTTRWPTISRTAGRVASAAIRAAAETALAHGFIMRLPEG
jgi:ABC-type multidrug transport system fused ATPase/permease subunit